MKCHVEEGEPLESYSFVAFLKFQQTLEMEPESTVTAFMVTVKFNWDSPATVEVYCGATRPFPANLQPIIAWLIEFDGQEDDLHLYPY